MLCSNNFCSHGNSLFFSPQPLDFNMLLRVALPTMISLCYLWERQTVPFFVDFVLKGALAFLEMYVLIVINNRINNKLLIFSLKNYK